MLKQTEARNAARKARKAATLDAPMGAEEQQSEARKAATLDTPKEAEKQQHEARKAATLEAPKEAEKQQKADDEAAKKLADDEAAKKEQEQQAHDNAVWEALEPGEPQGIILVASAPNRDHRCERYPRCEHYPGCGHCERQILPKLQSVVRGTFKQLVAAGWAEDFLNSHLPKGQWKDAWVGKLDAYRRACTAAGKSMHVVTIRGGSQCYWERLTLEGRKRPEKGSASERCLLFDDGESSQTEVPKLSHFESMESFMKWVEQHQDKLDTIDYSGNVDIVRQELELELRKRDQEIRDLENRLADMEAKSARDLADAETKQKVAEADAETYRVISNLALGGHLTTKEQIADLQCPITGLKIALTEEKTCLGVALDRIGTTSCGDICSANLMPRTGCKSTGHLVACLSPHAQACKWQRAALLQTPYLFRMMS